MERLVVILALSSVLWLLCSSAAGANGQAAKPLSVSELRKLGGRQGFVPYSGNPVIGLGSQGRWDAGALGTMCVVKVGRTFHLYYEAWGVRGDNWQDYNTLQIGHATSQDGIHWIKDSANPVVPKGEGWDKDGTWDPFVIHENGIFKMWFGGGMSNYCDWGYAYSKDGTHFTKVRQISKLGDVEDDHVIRDPKSGKYLMYYWDRKKEPGGLFRAESLNQTDFDFAGATNIKIEGEQYPGMYKFTHVFRDGGTWWMVYSPFVRPNCPGSTVRLASSPDGLHWTSRAKNLVAGHDGEMLKVAENLYLLFYGPQGYFDAAKCDIRVAIYSGKLSDLK